MALEHAYFRWSTLSSTGASTTVYGVRGELRGCRNITFIADANVAGDTAAIGIESGPTDTGFFDRMGSTAYSVSSGLAVTIQFTGPLECVRPYFIARTASTTVVNITLVGN